jgi:hypothetical protein
MFLPQSSRCCSLAPPGDEALPPALPQLRVHAVGDAGRAAVEAFIHRIYAQRYGADVRHFAPVLIGLYEGGRLLAAAGYRQAEQGALFLERYLDAPVEALLAGQAHAPTGRSGIVEVGHLASDGAGEGRRLILMLAGHFAQLHTQWVVCTLTEELRHLFVRIGITPLALGTADPAVLGAEASHWGSYYDHRPVVLAGNLPQASRQLMRRGAATGGQA